MATKKDKIFINLPTVNPNLFGRDRYLDILDKAWEDQNTNIVCFVAWGGVGKTALVNKWLTSMQQNNCKGAKKVFGWSFYSQGASEDRQVSADTFISEALRWFGDPNPDEGASITKGKRLANLIKQQRALFVLDGLEPLQFPPGPLGGYIKDPGLRALLIDLANSNPGLCVISTRLTPRDLENFYKTTIKKFDLENLSSEAGESLLTGLGVRGNLQEIRQAVQEFGGHALALNLLGTYLECVHDGDIRKKDRIQQLIYEESIQGYHARRVMESYEKWLNESEQGQRALSLLYMQQVQN